MSLLLLSASSAFAATVTVHFNSPYTTSKTVDRTVDGGTSWYLQDPGQFNFSLVSGPNGIPSQFYTFCIEPREFLTPGQTYTYNLAMIEAGATNIGGMGATKANLLRELLNDFYPDFSVQMDELHAAALQVAIWEIVRENQQGVGTYNLSTGDVRYRTWSDSAACISGQYTCVQDLAQHWLNSLTGTGGPYMQNVDALILAGGVQDVLVQFNGPNPLVPEPGTFVLMGSALILAGVGSRRLRWQSGRSR
ncbi:MAG: PEP-CTERM sorting domain-containing protein [Bryobacterales bacterium]|nr:PEP-CTERM sorting domain-containing protein [Bryobacterales bacterium]